MNDSEKRVLEYVRKCSADGYSPSVRDICRELGFSAPSTAHTYLTRLINEGYLERAGKTGRQIRPVEDRPVSIPVVTKYSHGLPVIDPSGEHVFFLPDRKPQGQLFAIHAETRSPQTGIEASDIVIAETTDYAAQDEAAVILQENRFPEFVRLRAGRSSDADEPVIGRIIGIIRYIR
ncbi:MAG: hypothetical protein K6G68_02265 [Oscillospiraceae bacterium]|nr:hypothetical protein [Oscillospiraceae bacterium]